MALVAEKREKYSKIFDGAEQCGPEGVNIRRVEVPDHVRAEEEVRKERQHALLLDCLVHANLLIHVVETIVQLRSMD